MAINLSHSIPVIYIIYIKIYIKLPVLLYSHMHSLLRHMTIHTHRRWKSFPHFLAISLQTTDEQNQNKQTNVKKWGKCSSFAYLPVL